MEITGFVSDPKISEPARRILGENHYLFWYPELQSCLRHGTPLNLFPSSANLMTQKNLPSANSGMIQKGLPAKSKVNLEIEILNAKSIERNLN